MAAYRSRPREIEAIRWTGENGPEVFDFLADRNEFMVGNRDAFPAVSTIGVRTAHGDVANVRPGDWIVREEEPGRFYPVKDHVFQRSYEAVT